MNRLQLGPQTSLDSALVEMTKLFTLAGIDDARREARLILVEALRVDLAVLVRNGDSVLGAASTWLMELANRRAAHEPLSRILGRREFYGLDFALGPETLDPRPETEHLVDAVLAYIDTHLAHRKALRVLDLGTGTGAILIAIAKARDTVSGLGVDIARGAIEKARSNAAMHGLGERLRFVQGDLFRGIDARFDIIVSNPPYIPSADLAGLMPEVRLFDPPRALDGGTDGLEFYSRIAAEAGAHLEPGGLVALEIGIGQHLTVPALLAEAGLDVQEIRPDLAEIPRVVTARAR